MPRTRDAFRHWVDQNRPPTTEESRRWWAEIKSRVASQTPEQIELGRQAWAAEQERDAQTRRQRMGLRSQSSREQRNSDWLEGFDSLDGPKAV
ncbi:MAG: hypothetical protein ACLQUY_20865 [Ktedonobacterales bacterium]